MDNFESLSHTVWECKYHVVFIPKCRRKTLYGQQRVHLGEVFRKLAAQKESRVEEGYLMPDHVHMLVSIPPKYAVSQVVGFIKGKSAIHLARVYGERKRNFVGQHFWARGTSCRRWGVTSRWFERTSSQGPGEGGRAAGPAAGPAWPLAMSRHRAGGASNEGSR
jgi:putative transposase